jgi:hypothetical protein
MKAGTLLTLLCLVTGCWIGSVSRAEACTCMGAETLAARDASAAVFEGTVVDQRITLFSDGAFLLPAPEQDIVVRRVWKGVATNRVSVLYLNRGMCSGSIPVGMTALFFLTQEQGRLQYALCSSNQPIAYAGEAITTLGPPIATFDDRPPASITVPATLPFSRRLRAFVVVGAAYYFNASVPVFHFYPIEFHPPLKWSDGLLLCALVLQFVAAIVFVCRRLPRRGLLLFATSALTLGALLLWTGHDLVTRQGMHDMLYWNSPS